MKVELTKAEPQVTITMSLQQAQILRELVRFNIEELVVAGFTIKPNLIPNANQILAYPLYNQLVEVL